MTIIGHVKGGSIYIQNVGAAHGHPTPSDANEFLKQIVKIAKDKKVKEPGFFCVTNGVQGKPRELMTQIGFTTDKCGHLWVSTLSFEAYQRASSEIEKVLEQERIAKELADKKAAEELAIEVEKLKARDILEGRKPGEIRVGDICWYVTHNSEYRKVHHYLITLVTQSVAYFTPMNDLKYYGYDHVIKNAGAYQPIGHWIRVDPKTEASYAKYLPARK